MNKLMFFISFLLITLSCSRNPVTGKRELMLVSESQEIAMGKEADPSIVAEYGLYEDPKLQAFITEKGKQTLPKLIYKLFENSKEINEMYVGIAYLKFVDKQKVINILESKVQDYKQMLIQSKEIKYKIQVTTENEGLLNFMSDHFLSLIHI